MKFMKKMTMETTFDEVSRKVIADARQDRPLKVTGKSIRDFFREKNEREKWA